MSRGLTCFRALLTLLVAALLIAACTGDEPEPEEEPSAESEKGEEAVDDDEDDAEGASSEAPSPLELEMLEIAEEVSVLRELPLLEEVDIDVVEPEDLAAIITEQGTEAEHLERTAALERVLIALRHLPEDADLQEIRERLLSSAVIGLYDQEEEVAYVSGEAEPLDPGAASTAAHELVHAVQDQHFDLERINDLPEEDGDGVLAFLSVVEGDAVIAEEEWSATHQTDEEREQAESDELASAEEQLRQLQDVPPYLLESFTFPYVVGERFVAALISEGGYEAVDEALENPPATTLEILDPDQYLSGAFEPGTIEISGDLGEGWESSLSSTFGAFDLLALFGSSAAPEALQGSSAWPAWRAGALEAWERDDEVVVAGAWAFADDERAGIVCDAVPAWYEDIADASAAGGDAWASGRDAMAVTCDGSEVRFAIAPDASTARVALGLD